SGSKPFKSASTTISASLPQPTMASFFFSIPIIFYSAKFIVFQAHEPNKQTYTFFYNRRNGSNFVGKKNGKREASQHNIDNATSLNKINKAGAFFNLISYVHLNLLSNGNKARFYGDRLKSSGGDRIGTGNSSFFQGSTPG